MKLAKNQEHIVTIERYGGEGAGIAHIEGQVVFVRGALRGEQCRILILKANDKMAFAKVMEVLHSSAQRMGVDCPNFPRCGGCTYRHMDYQEELWLKQQRVQDNLKRIGESSVIVEEILGAEQTEKYRNKAQYPVSVEGRVGFYRARTHEVIDTPRCLLVKDEANAAAQAVREYMHVCQVAGYHEKSGKGLIRHLYIRSNVKGESLICLIVNGVALPREEWLVRRLQEACPGVVGILLCRNERHDNVILGDQYRVLWGSAYLEDVLCGLTFRLSVPSFYQVHHDQAERLYEKAIAFAALSGRETVLDLYCGVGTITLVMARYAKRVIGAEIVPEAIEDARANAARNGIENAAFFCADAGAVARRFAEEGFCPDVITVDPPRKGLTQEVIDAMAKMNPQRIVYISCDSATLARDVKRLAEQGYCAVRAAAIDMFPRADHVECVVLMTKQ